MSPDHHIGIAGCGIGGLAVAGFLAQQGHAVTIFDTFETPSPVGSGLVIQPVGLDCLDRLGLLDAALQRGRPIYRMQGRESRSGRTVLKVDYGPRDGDAFGLAIHRADLFNILYQKVNSLNVTFIGGATVMDAELMGHSRHILTKDGRSFGPFDLVIDATGSKSPLSPIQTKALPYGALWGTVRWPANTDLPTDRLSQCYCGAHNMLGVLPLGHEGKTAIFWSEPQNSLSRWFQGDLENWKDKAIVLWPEFKPFVSQITEHSQMSAAVYRHGTLEQPISDRLAHIGDAAHQASPQLGQGANMALLDATALASALEQHDIPEALKVYMKARRSHVRFYQLISALFTPFYQSRHGIFPLIRNNLFHPGSQIWPMTRILTRLVSGNLVKTGL